MHKRSVDRIEHSATENIFQTNKSGANDMSSIVNQ